MESFSHDGVNLDALTAWMDRQGLGHGSLERPEFLVGGSQNILLRFVRAGRGYVLRRPPVHLRANSNETMRREARILASLAGTAVPHPALIAACTDENVLGAAFYLMAPVEGFNATTGLPALHASNPAIRRRMGLAMVEGIAALGKLDYRAVGLDGFGKPDNFLERQVARWLQVNRPASFHPGILHGDYHLANVMFQPGSGELAAIVDWELSTIGDPLLDLGWMISMWPEGDAPGDAEFPITPWSGFPTVPELIAHYMARSERDTSAIDWYVVLACYKLGILLEGTHARACAGKSPRELGDRLHAQTIRLFERALRRIG